MSEHPGDITKLIDAVKSGDQRAKGELYNLVEDELRNIAKNKMLRERPSHTLQPTVLINDVFLRLVGGTTPLAVNDRHHFYCAAARAMRQLLVDHERARRAQRRGGNTHERVFEDLDTLADDSQTIDILALDEALSRLNDVSPRQAEIVELHHFGGYTLADVAELVGVSKTTAKADWRIAKAWLFRELTRD